MSGAEAPIRTLESGDHNIHECDVMKGSKGKGNPRWKLDDELGQHIKTHWEKATIHSCEDVKRGHTKEWSQEKGAGGWELLKVN